MGPSIFRNEKRPLGGNSGEIGLTQLPGDTYTENHIDMMAGMSNSKDPALDVTTHCFSEVKNHPRITDWIFGVLSPEVLEVETDPATLF